MIHVIIRWTCPYDGTEIDYEYDLKEEDYDCQICELLQFHNEDGSAIVYRGR